MEEQDQDPPPMAPPPLSDSSNSQDPASSTRPPSSHSMDPAPGATPMLFRAPDRPPRSSLHESTLLIPATDDSRFGLHRSPFADCKQGASDSPMEFSKPKGFSGLMIRLDVAKIPEAHIMTRWTRQAKDVLPEHLKGHQNESPANKPLTIQSMKLNAKALELVSKGNTDNDTLQAAMKHINAAIKEIDAIIKAKARYCEVASEATMTEDAPEIQTDVEGVRGNRYGASGSSAGMSDSEILNMKAPIANRQRGRTRVKRFTNKADAATKKSAAKSRKTARRTTKTKTNENLTAGNTTTGRAKRQRKTIEDKMNSEENVGLPYQSRFCSKCKSPGHTRRTCGREGMPTQKKKKPVVRCSKCELKGHTDAECLVMDDDSDSFFK